MAIVVELTMLNKLSKPTDKAKGSLKRLDFEAKAAFKNASAAATQAAANIGRFAKSINKASKDIFNLRNAMVALVAVGIGKYAINTAADLELMALQLEVVSESGEKANQAFLAIRELARVSPLGTEDVIASFVRLRAVGIDPTLEQLKTLGGVGLLFNREMTQVLDSFIGLNKKTLRTLGVEIDRTGSKAIIASGDIRRVVNKDSASIREALLDVWERRFPDAITRAADTTKAKIELMQSNIYELAAVVGEALLPEFNAVTKVIGFMAESMKDIITGETEDKIQRTLDAEKRSLAVSRRLKFIQAQLEIGSKEVLNNELGAGKVRVISRERALALEKTLLKLQREIFEETKGIGKAPTIQGSGSLGAKSDKDGEGAAEKAKKLAEEQRDRFNAAQARVREFNALDAEIAEAQEKQKEEIAKAGAEALKQIRENDYLDAKASWEKKQRLIDEEQSKKQSVFGQSLRLARAMTSLGKTIVAASKADAEKKKKIMLGLAIADAATAAVSGIASAMDLPFPANLLAAAATAIEVVAMTAGQISSIKNSSFARGTMGFSGGGAIVGEQGPERVKLPTGSQVYTNSQTRQMINNSSSVTIPVTITGNATPETVGMLKDELGAFGRKIEDAIRYGAFDPSKVGLVTV